MLRGVSASLPANRAVLGQPHLRSTSSARPIRSASAPPATSLFGTTFSSSKPAEDA